MATTRITRRAVVRGMGGAVALHLAGWPGVAAAARGASARDPRLVVVLLRGGLDGLAAVPALGDPHFASARAGLAPDPQAPEGAPVPLDDLFGLDPRLGSLARAWSERRLTVVHAVALPYRERSHFDAQNLMESGGTKPFALQHGWAGRALEAAGAAGVGLQPVTPLVLRGAAAAGSWSPSSLPAPSARLVETARSLYARDAMLAHSLTLAEQSQRMLAGESAAVRGDGSFASLATAAGAFLTHPEGPRVAVLELGGFDSHSLQALPYGGLGRALRELDDGLAALRARLGPAWDRTVVVATTEFGRTVAMNGSGGTDHGTASAAFVLGGAVDGGRVVADWPGLAPGQLHEGRDLRPTRDLRSVWKGVLHDHLRISEGALAARVFPDSDGVAPLEGLVRG